MAVTEPKKWKKSKATLCVFVLNLYALLTRTIKEQVSESICQGSLRGISRSFLQLWQICETVQIQKLKEQTGLSCFLLCAEMIKLQGHIT